MELARRYGLGSILHIRRTWKCEVVQILEVLSTKGGGVCATWKARFAGMLCLG